MLFADGGLAVVLTLAWVYFLLEAITADASRVRNLPKVTWVFILFFTFDIGVLLWLVAGRPQGAARSLPYKGNTGVPAEYDRPGRATANSPDDDAAFLDGLKRRAQEQRDRAAEQQRDLDT